MNTVLEQIEKFKGTLQKFTDDYMDSMEYSLKVDIGIKIGKKYAKVIKSENGKSGSVHSFINLENGDILKAASWAAPAKGVRGNIFDVNEGACTAWNVYGANYR
jgi:hypothetical protein|tara:strand:+ start:12231 stop:12542 length:312 start_codon:yes stop_codon:yes gene_type:complete